MKNLYLICSALPLAIFLIGCSPSVYTHVQTRYPANPPRNVVTIYDVDQPAPAHAEILGDLGVHDTGFSTDCSFPKVLQIAIDETNKIGGNAFKITRHILPSVLGSSCHQISGTMLRLSDSADIESDEAVPPAAPNPVQHIAQARNSGQLRTTLHFSPGYAFIVSKYIVPSGFSGNLKRDLNLDAGIDRISRSGFGGGLRYLGYLASGTYYKDKYGIRVHYIGPELVWRSLSRTGKWSAHLAAGVGYAHYTEKVESLSAGVGGFGFHATLGAEYRIAPNIGIGIQATIYSTRFSSMDKITQNIFADDKLRAGIGIISLNGGIRFHF